jgi:hypothetical protein
LDTAGAKSDRHLHSFNPLEVNFTRVPEDSKTQEFKDYLEENPGVQRSFDEQFILGMGYEYTYLSKSGDLYFRGGLDVAGNLLKCHLFCSGCAYRFIGPV